MKGRPQTVSARILAYMQFKSSTCTSYKTQVDCFANPADGCGWDKSAGGGCFVSLSSAFDPEVLRGRLYCDGSLLDAAARCALAAPTAAAGSGDSTGRGCATMAGAECAFMGSLPASTQSTALSTAARSYLRLAALVTYTAADPSETAGGGLCTARWLQHEPTLERLQRAVAANPGYGLLQSELLGSCNGTEWLVKALAAATAKCAAAGAGAGGGGGAGGGAADDAESPQATCAAAAGCRWDAGSGVCEAGYDMLYDALYDQNDPWVKAFSEAYDTCDAATSSAACEAAAAALPTLDIDAARMSYLQYALKDPNWTMGGGGGGGGVDGDGGDGGGAAAAGGGVTPWLTLIFAAVTTVLLGGGGGDGALGRTGGGGGGAAAAWRI